MINKSGVRIIPNGSTNWLSPDIPVEITIYPSNIKRAIEHWDRINPKYAGLLGADVQDLTKEDIGWVYDTGTNRYRDTENGRFISERRVRGLVKRYQIDRKDTTKDYARRLGDGTFTLSQWVENMRTELKDTYTAVYMAGRGGQNAMTQEDWGRIGGTLRVQYGYLNGFADDIASGNLTEAQIAARAGLYIASATQMFERAKTQGAQSLTLPAYPGDGTTECLSNCKCHWAIKDNGDHWSCVWTLSAAEHCATCLSRASAWSPLIVWKV